jgi:hypothetical protein
MWYYLRGKLIFYHLYYFLGLLINKNYAFYFQRVEKSEKSTVYNHLKYKKKKTSTLNYNNFYLLKGFRSSH